MTKGNSLRMRKVNETLREVIADEVADLKDPRLGFVTITAVAASPDLHRATVLYSALGGEDEREGCQEALDSAASRIRARVGTQVRLKYLPELEFAVDPSIDTGLRISQLLSDVEGPLTDNREEE